MLRRSFLRVMPATAAALTLPTLARAAPTPIDPRERLEAAIAEFKAAASAVYPQISRWAELHNDEPDHTVPLTLMAIAGKPQEPPRFTGPGVYEFEVLDTEGLPRCSPTAFLDVAPNRSGWFRWQHYWRGKFEGRGHLLPQRRIRIVRKMEALG